MQNGNHGTTSDNNKQQQRPSDARRQALAESVNYPMVSNFFPLERYYDAAQKAYEGVLQCTDNPARLDECYVYGKRYCLFCLEAIPTHNYYDAPKFKSDKVRHRRQVEKVIAILEKVANQMDAEEAERQKQAKIRAKREAAQRERREKERYEQLQRRLERQTQPSQQRTQQQQQQSGDVQESALSKLALLRPLAPPGEKEEEDEARIRRDPSGEKEPRTSPTTGGSRYRLILSSDESEEEGELPPPVPPPSDQQEPPPPSYQSAVTSKRRGNGRPESSSARDSSSSFFTVRPPPAEVDVDDDELSAQFNGTYQPPAVPQRLPPARQQKRATMREVQERCRQEYLWLLKARKIVVSAIDTYQGRVSDSTNGCTVISALIAAHHLELPRGQQVISDGAVVQIIDRQAGPILREIRRKLGLGGAALIIPSDVHDHLVDKKILHQDKFAGAAGGNIMDENHYGEFLKLLAAGDDGKASSYRAAATLFFREHVISIVKHFVGSTAVYDLIDSMPSAGLMSASRTRCQDLASLEVLLKWYASRKFSDQHCTYIDRNQWEDDLADVDPRVFQGFVWSDKRPEPARQ
jgi:hypothetical protein